MARAPNEKVLEAKTMFQAGLKMVEIADKLGVPPSTVRRWKSTYNWDRASEKKQSERSLKNNERSEYQSERSKIASNPPRQRGGQFGNTNAVGNSGGGPIGNTYALKNATYAERYWKYISDDEKAMIDDTPTDEEAQLIQSLKLTEIRELRHMQMLSRYRELLEKSPDGMILKEDLKSVIEEYSASGKRKTTKEASQTRVDASEQMQIIEAELTRIQRVKLNIIQTLSKLRAEKAKTAENDANDVQIILDWSRDD